MRSAASHARPALVVGAVVIAVALVALLAPAADEPMRAMAVAHTAPHPAPPPAVPAPSPLPAAGLAPPPPAPRPAPAPPPRRSASALAAAVKGLKGAKNAEPVVLTEMSPARPGKKTVALTFDDGPDATWTPQVLDLLDEFDAKATFCLVSDNVAANRKLVSAEVKAGHRLCDHSWTHPQNFSALAPAQQADQILGARVDLAAASKAAVPYFRAPGGNWSPSVISLAAKNKMQPLGWTTDPRDWSRPGVESIVKSVQSGVRPGAIILMHDGGGDRQQTVDALRVLLPWLVDQGYGFSFPTK